MLGENFLKETSDVFRNEFMKGLVKETLEELQRKSLMGLFEKYLNICLKDHSNSKQELYRKLSDGSLVEP